MKHETFDLGSDDVCSLFRRLFFPTLIGMLSVSAVTAIDGIFVGHGVGSHGIAAVNICIPLLMILTGIGLMVGAGCSVVASVCMSRGQLRQARACVTEAMIFITVVATVLVSPVWLYPELVAYMLGSSGSLLPMVVDYLVWFAPSLIFELWIAVGLFVLRLDGAPRLAMWCSVVSAVANIFFDWLFIFPFGWGVMGAALATSISCLLGAAIVLWYLAVGAGQLRLHFPVLSRRGLSYSFRNILEMCRIGSSAMLGELTMATLMFVGNHVFMRYLGDDGVGAFGVSCYYLPFVFMVGNAIAQSAQPIISFNYGKGDGGRVASAFGISLRTAVVCGAISTAAFMFMPRVLTGLFLDLDDMSARIAVAGFPYYGMGFVFFVVNLAVIGYCQSLERVLPASAFAVMRGFLFLVPCFMLLPRLFGTVGIWLALPVSEIMTSTAALLYFVVRRRWHHFQWAKNH